MKYIYNGMYGISLLSDGYIQISNLCFQECLSEENEPGYCRAGRCSCKNCVPDARDFGGATIARPIPLAAILLGAVILKNAAMLA